MAAPDAARILMRRYRAKNRYRRMRDRRISEWVGKEYEFQHMDPLHGIEWLKVRLVAYDPDRHNVVLCALWPTAENQKVTWTTDALWAMLRSERMKEV